jgi:topoisomerase-4 subunit A
MVYNLIYNDGASGTSMVKRFNILGVTRDKEYNLTKGSKGSKVLYFTANPNGEAEVVSITLTPAAKAKVKVFDFDFASLDVKGRDVQGNILTKYPIKKVAFKQAGISTLAGTEIYYDGATGRLSNDKKDLYLGSFKENDLIVAFYKDGSYELTNYELTNRYDVEKLQLIEKYNPECVVSVLYLEAKSKTTYIKRFKFETTTTNKKFPFIAENEGNELLFVTTQSKQRIKVDFAKGKYITNPTMDVNIDQFVDIKGWKAIGNKFSTNKINQITLLTKPVNVSTNSPDSFSPGTTIELNFN